MAFFCKDEPYSTFTSRSVFTPASPPEILEVTKKKDPKEGFLPGERLLIKLGKRGKSKKQQENLDIDKLQKSLSRVLNF
jgi:hypothetical protein